MQRERLTEDIIVFRSSLYAQVTAGLLLTDDGAVLIDTLLYPQETQRIRRFINEGLRTELRYVINTHYHADHSAGNCLFPEAEIIAQRQCPDLLHSRGQSSLQSMAELDEQSAPLTLRVPELLFDECMTLELGQMRLSLRACPGHSPDSLTCLVEGEDILFAADSLMPLPYFGDGDWLQLHDSLLEMREREYEVIVQGHGDIVLRGEVAGKISSDLDYLLRLREAVGNALADGIMQPEERIRLQDCGKSHDGLHGAVRLLHIHNVQKLADELRDEHLSMPRRERMDGMDIEQEWEEIWQQK